MAKPGRDTAACARVLFERLVDLHTLQRIRTRVQCIALAIYLDLGRLLGLLEVLGVIFLGLVALRLNIVNFFTI